MTSGAEHQEGHSGDATPSFSERWLELYDLKEISTTVVPFEGREYRVVKTFDEEIQKEQYWVFNSNNELVTSTPRVDAIIWQYTLIVCAIKEPSKET
jgi:hypothetical protein